MQVNTIREVTDCNSKNFGKLRPVMNTTGYRIPIDGKATTLSNCNQEVLDDYGINMQCFGQWTTDHCNAALDVSATDCAHSCCLNCDICRSMHKWRSRPLISNTTTAKLGLEGYESDEHVQSDKLKRAMNELRALAAQTDHSWLWASVYSGSDSDGEE